MRTLTIAIAAVFGLVISCPAMAQQDDATQVGLDRNRVAFTTCVTSNVQLHQGELHQVKMVGGNELAVLVMSCGILVDSYTHFCEQAGNAEAACYGDLKEMAADALMMIGD